MTLSTAQLDVITDILLNFPQTELERLLINLNSEELLELRREALALIDRQKTILGLVDARLE